MNYTEHEIHSKEHDTSFKIAPERGALITSITVQGKELLYLDRPTFEDPSKNVRGGVPLLFPFCGSLIDGKLKGGGSMKQHGYARNVLWKVLKESENYIELGATGVKDFLDVYPWEHLLKYRVETIDSGIRASYIMTNESSEEMPVSPGWHPYFPCPRKKKAQLYGNLPQTDRGCVRDDKEVNFGVIAPSDGETKFYLPELGSLKINFSPEMHHVQVWSLPGRDFVCIEPFHGPPNTINSINALKIPAGETMRLWMEIRLADTRI